MHWHSSQKAFVGKAQPSDYRIKFFTKVHTVNAGIITGSFSLYKLPCISPQLTPWCFSLSMHSKCSPPFSANDWSLKTLNNLSNPLNFYSPSFFSRVSEKSLQPKVKYLRVKVTKPCSSCLRQQIQKARSVVSVYGWYAWVKPWGQQFAGWNRRVRGSQQERSTAGRLKPWGPSLWFERRCFVFLNVVKCRKKIQWCLKKMVRQMGANMGVRVVGGVWCVWSAAAADL